jgi:hypothetical protein
MENDFLFLQETLEDIRREHPKDEYQAMEPRVIEELGSHVDELKAIHQALIFQIQNGILYLRKERASTSKSHREGIGKRSESSHSQLGIWEDHLKGLLSYRNKTNPIANKQEIMEDEMWNRYDAFIRDMLQNMNKKLNDLNIFHEELELNPIYGINSTAVRLQNHIFQIIDYMYQHKFINKSHFQLFLEMDNTLEVSAITKIIAFKLKYKFSAGHLSFASSKIMPQNWYFSHFRSIPQGEINIRIKIQPFSMYDSLSY